MSTQRRSRTHCLNLIYVLINITIFTTALLVLGNIFPMQHDTFSRRERNNQDALHKVTAFDLWKTKELSGSERIRLQDLKNGKRYSHEAASNPHQYSSPTSQCGLISSQILWDLAGDIASSLASSPLMYHFHNGNVIRDNIEPFIVGDELCSVIFAPQSPRDEFGNPGGFTNRPIEGWGPDSIHAEIASEDVRLIFKHPEYWGSVSEGSLPLVQPSVYAIYTVPFTLNQPGVYQVSGEIEFQNYDWVMEDPIDLTRENIPYLMLSNSLIVQSPPITVIGNPISRPTSRCHHDGNLDLHGRWYRASSFSYRGNQTALNRLARLEFADHKNTIDEWGWTFAPDACSLTYFNPQDHIDCLGERTIQVLGDSNSRRVMKSIIGGGVAWCTSPRDQICQCEDHFQEEIYDSNFNKINTSRFRRTDERNSPITFANKSKIYFDFVGGLLNAKIFNPWQLFFDELPGHPSVIAQRVETHGRIDVVHISFIGWDMASIRTPTEVLDQLPTFRNILLKAYPPGTRFIHRLANSMCRGNMGRKNRYSAPRFAMWNVMWRNFWAEDEARGALRIVDPSVLQGRRDAETAFFCPTTHLRASHVRLEQMMWMGAVCEKLEGERARMRDFGYSAETLADLGPSLNEVRIVDRGKSRRNVSANIGSD